MVNSSPVFDVTPVSTILCSLNTAETMKQKLKLGVVEFITKKYRPNQPKKFLQPHQVKCLMTRIETHIRVLSSPFRILMTPEIDPPHHLRRYFLAY